MVNHTVLLLVTWFYMKLVLVGLKRWRDGYPQSFPQYRYGENRSHQYYQKTNKFESYRAWLLRENKSNRGLSLHEKNRMEQFLYRYKKNVAITVAERSDWSCNDKSKSQIPKDNLILQGGRKCRKDIATLVRGGGGFIWTWCRPQDPKSDYFLILCYLGDFCYKTFPQSSLLF